MTDVVERLWKLAGYNGTGANTVIRDGLREAVAEIETLRARLSQAGAGGGVVEALEECEEYFDQRADADCDQDGFIPNREMRLLSVVRGALAALAPSPVDLHGAWTNQADQKAIRTQMTATPPVPPVPTASVEVLPCDVAVAPCTIIRKGCEVSTLMLAIDQRKGREVGGISDAALSSLTPAQTQGDGK